MENTLVLIKPDGVAKGVCGDIISRFERRGLHLIGLKLIRISQEQAARGLPSSGGPAEAQGIDDNDQRGGGHAGCRQERRHLA